MTLEINSLEEKGYFPYKLLLFQETDTPLLQETDTPLLFKRGKPYRFMFLYSKNEQIRMPRIKDFMPIVQAYLFYIDPVYLVADLNVSTFLDCYSPR